MPLGFITRHNVDPGGEGVVLLNEHVNEVNDRATPVRRRRENRRICAYEALYGFIQRTCQCTWHA